MRGNVLGNFLLPGQIYRLNILVNNYDHAGIDQWPNCDHNFSWTSSPSKRFNSLTQSVAFR